jgi:drug/metabolite transporter (DMT)-like permease
MCASTAAAIWGGMYVVSDAVLEVVQPATFLVMRYALGLATLWIVFLARRERGIARRDWPEVALVAFVGFGVSLLAQFGGTKLSTAAAGAVITSATPAFIIVFAWPLLREAPSAAKLSGLALATAGVLIVSLLGGQVATEQARDPLLGNLLLIVAGVSWALYTVLARRATRRFSTLAISTAVAAFGIPMVLPLAVAELSAQPLGALTPAAIGGILYVGIGSTGIALFLWNKSFELLDAATASLFFFAQPVVGTLLSALALNERLGWAFFIGSALILLGVLLAMRVSTDRQRINEWRRMGNELTNGNG